MRKKTEEKMEQIVATAARIFIERGYDATSMSEIASAIGGSKATVYNYFPSKNELFIEVMLRSAGKLGANILKEIEGTLPLREKLERFGAAYLDFILSDHMVAIRRTVMAEVRQVEDIGEQIYARGLKKKWSAIAALIEHAMQDGTLHKKTAPWLAAMQLRGLLEADLLDQRILGIIDQPPPAQTKTAAKMATDIFWTYYAK